MNNTGNSVLVWAVDSNDAAPKPSGSSLRFLEERRVLPVSVSSNLNEISQIQLSNYIKSTGCTRFLKPKLLVTDTFNRTDFVKAILSFALGVGADAIALTSRGRKGIDRLIMGSFAEKLLEVSSLPILFLSGENFKPTRRAIFATDFSIESEVAFRNFIPFCNEHIDEIIIYHADHSLVEAIASYSASGVPAIFPSEFITDKTRENEESKLKVWINQYSRFAPKIRFKTLIQDSIQTVSKSILDVCKKEQVELIGISSTLRPWERAFLGSVSRDIFRSGKVPVWIWGEFASEKDSKKFKSNRVQSSQKSVSRAQKSHDA